MRALVLCLALTVLAMPVLAARVVDVRVGQHPTFTRIVFQLDQMRGYRLERDGDANVLVVSLDASATPESIASRGLVDRVVVEQAVGGAVARIYLKGKASNPRVQEMILGKPPRIVLDVIEKDAVAAVVPEATPAPEPEPTLPDVTLPEPEPEPVAVTPEPEPTLPDVTLPEPEVAVIDPVEVVPVDDTDVAERPPVPDVTEDVPVDDATATPTEAPVEVAKPVVPQPAPPAAKDSRGEGGMLQDPMVVGGGALVVFLALIGFVMMRRKKKASEWSPEDGDTSIFDDPEEASAEAAGEATSVAEAGSEEDAGTPIPGAFSMDDLVSGEDSPAASTET